MKLKEGSRSERTGQSGWGWGTWLHPPPQTTCFGDIRPWWVGLQSGRRGWGAFPRVAMLLGSKGLIQHCPLAPPGIRPLEAAFVVEMASRSRGQGSPGGLLLFPCPHAAPRLAVEGPWDSPDPAPSALAHSGNTHRGREGLAGPVQGGGPAPERRTRRPWDADQEAVVPPAPPPPTPPPMSGLPGGEPDPSLCAGARLMENRPLVWEQGRRARSRGRC